MIHGPGLLWRKLPFLIRGIEVDVLAMVLRG
jgi:hypothetical protein